MSVGKLITRYCFLHIQHISPREPFYCNLIHISANLQPLNSCHKNVNLYSDDSIRKANKITLYKNVNIN